MPPTSLPSPRQVLTDLLSQLQEFAPQEGATANPLHGASEDTKKILLTFHVMYPNEFLPSLDLLDRRLLTKLTIKSPSTSGTEDPEAKPTTTAASQRHTPLYIVRSAQQPRGATSAGRAYDALITHYEVRLLAWNCSCPAFTFAAFPASSSASSSEPDAMEAELKTKDECLALGGLSRGSGTPPVCKHLLACVFAEHCPMFRPFVEERDVSAEEVAGWCAGWGD